MLKQLAGQTAVYGLGTIIPRFLSYLMFPYFTRIMATGEYGVVTDLYALIPFLLVVLTMGLETGYFRFAGKAETPLQKRKVFSTAWGTVSLFALLFFVAAQLFALPIAAVMDYAAHPSYIRIVAGIVLFDAATAIPFARLRQEGRALRFIKLRILSVCINLLLTVFFYSALPWLAGHGILASLYDPCFGAGYVLVANLLSSAAMLLCFVPMMRDSRPTVEPALLRAMMLYSLPILVSGIAGTANEFIDRQMIKYLMPASEAMSALGVYGAVAKLGVILVLFTQMYRYAAEPYFLSGFKTEDFRTSNAVALKYFVIVSVGIFLFIMVFVDQFALLMGAAFRQGIGILPLILLANILIGMTLNMSFWYKQSEKTQYALWITGTGLLVTIGMNLLLVPRCGYAGAAWARLCCEVVMVVVSYALNQRFCRTPYDVRRIGEYFLAGGALYGVTELAGPLPTAPRIALGVLLLALYGCFAVRRERIDVKALLKSITKR